MPKSKDHGCIGVLDVRKKEEGKPSSLCGEGARLPSARRCGDFFNFFILTLADAGSRGASDVAASLPFRSCTHVPAHVTLVGLDLSYFYYCISSFLKPLLTTLLMMMRT